MRLDKFLVHAGIATRKEAAKLIRGGHVTVSGVCVKRPESMLCPETDPVAVNGESVCYRAYTYLMLNKPAGLISATDDPRQRTVLELLPQPLQRIGLFPCGRLDKDTVGLLILTNDGALAHRLLSPKHHAEKSYRFETDAPIPDPDALRRGVDLGDFITLPCTLTLDTPQSGLITLTEGKYHQIKRMTETQGAQITFLERVSFAGIPLDASLARGAWRYLSDEEIAKLQAQT